MSNIAAVPGTASGAAKGTCKRKLWKEQFGSPGRREWPQEQTLGKPPVMPNRGRFAAGLAVASRSLLIASCLSHWV